MQIETIPDHIQSLLLWTAGTLVLMLLLAFWAGRLAKNLDIDSALLEVALIRLAWTTAALAWAYYLAFGEHTLAALIGETRRLRGDSASWVRAAFILSPVVYAWLSYKIWAQTGAAKRGYNALHSDDDPLIIKLR